MWRVSKGSGSEISCTREMGVSSGLIWDWEKTGIGCFGTKGETPGWLEGVLGEALFCPAPSALTAAGLVGMGGTASPPAGDVSDIPPSSSPDKGQSLLETGLGRGRGAGMSFIKGSSRRLSMLRVRGVGTGVVAGARRSALSLFLLSPSMSKDVRLRGIGFGAAHNLSIPLSEK